MDIYEKLAFSILLVLLLGLGAIGYFSTQAKIGFCNRNFPDVPLSECFWSERYRIYYHEKK
jgi:hypothetical protein